MTFFNKFLDYMSRDSISNIPRNRQLIFEIFTAMAVIFTIIFLGYSRSLYFDGSFADGPFQLLNALRRITDGQILGRDFNFFHGIGTLYIHLPLYLLFGKNLFASEFSRQIISPLLFMIINYSFLYLLAKDKRIAIVGTMLMLLLSHSYQAVLDPGNSMLGVRSFTIFVLIMYFMFFIKKKQNEFKILINHLIIGLLLGFSIFISTESGLAVNLAFFSSYSLIFHEKWSVKFKRIFFTLISLAFSIYIYYYVICGDYWIACLKFLFLEVPADQFWYFGVYPTAFIKNMFGFFANKKFSMIFIVSLLMLFYLYRKYKEEQTIELFSLTVLILYGIFSTIPLLAIYDPNYYGAPLARIVYLLAIVFVSKKYMCRLSDTRYIIFLLISLVLFSVFSIKEYRAIFHKPITVYDTQNNEWRKEEPHFSTQKQLGVFLSDKWDKHLTNVKSIITKEKSEKTIFLWSTYASVVEAELNIFHPYIDYIIHGLGPERRTEYASKFKQIQPDYVRTDNPKVWVFGDWLRTEHWEFYKELFINYSLVYGDEQGLLWEKNNVKAMVQSLGKYSTSLKDQSVFVLEEVSQREYRPDSAYSVKIKYNINNPYLGIPYISKLPRYFIYIDNAACTLPVSLPPYKNEFSFPILPTLDGSLPTIKPKIESILPGCDISITEVEVEKILLPEKTLQYLY